MTTAFKPSETVAKRLDSPRGLMINGQWIVENGQPTSEVINPSTGHAISTAVNASIEEVDLAVAAARERFDKQSWSGLNPAERAKVLWRVAELM